jgi:hypothetical protein
MSPGFLGNPQLVLWTDSVQANWPWESSEEWGSPLTSETCSQAQTGRFCLQYTSQQWPLPWIGTVRGFTIPCQLGAGRWFWRSWPHLVATGSAHRGQQGPHYSPSAMATHMPPAAGSTPQDREGVTHTQNFSGLPVLSLSNLSLCTVTRVCVRVCVCVCVCVWDECKDLDLDPKDLDANLCPPFSYDHPATFSSTVWVSASSLLKWIFVATLVVGEVKVASECKQVPSGVWYIAGALWIS